MTQYIDKAALVAEIERRYKYWREKEFKSHSIESEIRMSECQHLMLLLNTLEVKEVDLEDEDMVDREIARENSILDETRVEYFATGNPTIAAYSEDNLRNQFDAGADWMKEQLIRAFKGEK